jgi:hypothetical protein
MLTPSLSHVVVQQHPDQTREGIVDEELVGLRVTGDRERGLLLGPHGTERRAVRARRMLEGLDDAAV